MEEVIKKIKEHIHSHYLLTCSTYQGVSLAEFCEMFVVDNAIRDTTADELRGLKALLNLVVIKKVDQTRRLLDPAAATATESCFGIPAIAKELFGEGGITVMLKTHIYRTKLCLDSTTSEAAKTDIMNSTTDILDYKEMLTLLVDFQGKLKIESFIPFNLELTIVDGIDVDNIIGKFCYAYTLLWTTKISPAHYAVLVDCIIQAIDKIKAHTSNSSNIKEFVRTPTFEEFVKITETHKITSPFAWCFKRLNINGIQTFAFRNQKEFALVFGDFVTRYLQRTYVCQV